MTVFSLNTLAGFGCAVGLDMGFNSSDKDEITEATLHKHADGKDHYHTPELPKATADVHSHGKNHQHQHTAETTHQEKKETSKKSEDGCCNDDVLKFQSLDKNLTPAKTALNSPALIAILSTFLAIDIFEFSSTSQLHTARYLFPPPPNILISIQRFQI